MPISATPSVAVARATTTRAVESRTSSGRLRARQYSATVVVMEDKKIKPASCTWPTAKGMEERATKAAACTAEERRTRRTRSGRYGAGCVCVWGGGGGGLRKVD